jgi:hypothetical protein
MQFDQALYHDEMVRVLRAARGILAGQRPPVRVYTVAIWTDPSARLSTVSVDTRAHSDAQVAALTAWAREEHPRLVATGLADAADAALRLPRRNVNPADFALRDLVEVRHQAFGQAPAGGSSPVEPSAELWDALEQALERVGLAALQLFADIPLELDAELGVNTRGDWYGRTWAFGAPAA